jgi:hypothetical protein
MNRQHIASELLQAAKEVTAKELAAASLRAFFQTLGDYDYYVQVTKKLDLGGTISQAELKRELDGLGSEANKAAGNIVKNLKRRLDELKENKVTFNFKATTKDYEVILDRGVGVQVGVFIEVSIKDDHNFYIETGFQSDGAALRDYIEGQLEDMRLKKAK